MIGLVIGGAYAGFGCLTRDDNGEGSTPVVSDAPGGPGATANAFAKAWTAGDTNGLYGLLSQSAQRAYPAEVFSETYGRFADELTLVSLTATATAASPGRATLAVRLATAYFGDIEYTTTLNLSQTAQGWAVEWQPEVISPEMANGREFKSIIQRPIRGSILDRNGEPLAVTKDLRTLGLNRSLVRDPAALRTALVDFGFTAGQVDGAFSSGAGASQRVRVGPVPDEKAEEAITTLRNIPGVVLYFESQRVHPLGAAAAHAVGYTRELTAEELANRKGTGYRAGDRVGATGLEASQDQALAGSIGAELRVVDSTGELVKVVLSRPFQSSVDVTTTLDAATLRAAYARLGARAGAAVVIDPKTNAVLALNSSPSFDPDAFERNDGPALAAITAAPNGPLANRATTGLYSAGSTFKLITGDRKSVV